MDIQEIYCSFSGDMENCSGRDCEKACCFSSSKKGVDVYPDEVKYYAKKFGEDFPAKIIRDRNSETGFVMTGCLQNECTLKNDRPIICRGFPVKPFSLGRGHRIGISEDCPMHTCLSPDYIRKSYILWEKVYKDFFRTSFIKKLVASWYLRKLP